MSIRSFSHIGIYLSLIVVISCSDTNTLFTNPAPEDSGITFSNDLTETDDLNILDYLYFYNGGGVAVGDINGDNLPDIYLSGNQVKNKLYLNKGNLQFEDITTAAGVAGNSTWNTGSVMGDVNGDGLLDIYVCAVVGINGFNGYNELFINNGDNTFTESAGKYGLDFDTYSSNAAFLDYDKDGDLDIYLLNHAVHTQNSFGKADLRYKRVFETGDKLLRNDGNTFTDVSEEAGIFGGVNSYGLGIAVSDFNNDGWPDLYVGNDFHEDDYYYLNQGKDSTGVVRFRESLKEHFGHTSRFSMGNDVADINQDGWPDLISLDMLPQDEKVLKSSEGDDNIQTQKLRTQQFGYHYQFTRNMLYVNQQEGDFMETALLSGIAATDWSWSALFADFDNDTQQDLFVANGIPKRPNNLDYIKFVSSDQIQNKISNTKLIDQNALQLMPSGITANFMYKGGTDLRFEDMSSRWIANDTLASGASALADLDNDGDIDIITNNLNQEPTLYINQTPAINRYLQLKFDYKKPNTYGIGTKVLSYLDGKLQMKELYTVRGFQASSEPAIHFGYGAQVTTIDSLRIIWPDNSTQLLSNINVNQTLNISPENTVTYNYDRLRKKSIKLFEPVLGNLGVNFTHQEDPYLDFNRQKLIPYMVSDRGPAVATGDLNGDGTEDIFFGSSKFKESMVFHQKDSTSQGVETSFTKASSPILPITEEVVATIADFDQDGANDLLIGTGGADFFGKSPKLLDQYLVKTDTSFVASALPEMYQNASVIAPYDIDNDGDLDVFIGNQSITGDFGQLANSYLLLNENGTFTTTQSQTFAALGMLTDAIWDDFTGDGVKDLIVVGEWMAPIFFENSNGQLQKRTPLETLNGLWQSIQPFDIDQDGDMDYLLGNWGTNSKFTASEKEPMRLYYNDFDNNGQTETIIATAKDGEYYPLPTFDELSSQLVSLKKKYGSYKSFAGQAVEDIFSKEQLKNTTKLEVHTLASGYLKNNEGSFTFIPFKSALQTAPLMDFCVYDFDNDGRDEALVGGNYFGVKPYHGRLDSFSGALVKDENTVTLGHFTGLKLSQKSARDIRIITVGDTKYLLVTFNNDSAQVYALTSYK